MNKAEYNALLIHEGSKKKIVYKKKIDGGHAAKINTEVQFLSNSKYGYQIRIFSYTYI